MESSITPTSRRSPVAAQHGLHPPLLLENAFSREVCTRFIQLFNDSNARPRSYQGVVDHKLRECDFVTLQPEWDPLFHNVVTQHMTPYFDRDINPVLRDRPMLYGYPVGVGFVPHHDMVTSIEVKRGETNRQPVIGGDYTMVLFCASPDSYDGGELYFPDLGWIYKPSAGSAVIYPTTADYVHGVKPITRGIRYTVVARFFHR